MGGCQPERVPIVNIFYLLSLAGRPAWQFLLLCIPLVNIFVYGAMFGDIADRLKMPTWLGWCMLLPIANVFIIAKERGWKTAAAMGAFIFPVAFAVGGLVRVLMLGLGFGATS